MERILMKLEILKNELNAELNAAMAQKVRLEEQTDVNNTNIQRLIGGIDMIAKAQEQVEEIRKADAETIDEQSKAKTIEEQLIRLDEQIKEEAKKLQAGGGAE